MPGIRKPEKRPRVRELVQRASMSRSALPEARRNPSVIMLMPISNRPSPPMKCVISSGILMIPHSATDVVFVYACLDTLYKGSATP